MGLKQQSPGGKSFVPSSWPPRPPHDLNSSRSFYRYTTGAPPETMQGGLTMASYLMPAWGHWPGCCIWHIRSENGQIRQILLLIAKKIITIMWSQTLLSHQRKFICSQVYKNDTWHNHPWWSNATIQTGHRDKQYKRWIAKCVNMAWAFLMACLY